MCDECGGIVKTATISFGQSMPLEPMRRSEEETLACDLFLATGSSLVVYPAAGFPALAEARRREARDPQPRAHRSRFDRRPGDPRRHRSDAGRGRRGRLRIGFPKTRSSRMKSVTRRGRRRRLAGRRSGSGRIAERVVEGAAGPRSGALPRDGAHQPRLGLPGELRHLPSRRDRPARRRRREPLLLRRQSAKPHARARQRGPGDDAAQHAVPARPRSRRPGSASTVATRRSTICCATSWFHSIWDGRRRTARGPSPICRTS